MTLQNKLILRAVPSPFIGQYPGQISDVTKNSVLSWFELDGDLLYLKGESVYTGLTSGDTLTLYKLNGQSIEVDLSPSMSGSVLYTNSNPTYVDIGGIERGSTFSGVTMQDMWTDLLYPDLNPRFTSFSISGYSTSVDVGYTLSTGNKTWVWSTINTGFIQPDTIKIIDITNGTILASDLNNDGEEIIPTPIDIQKTTRTSHRWDISAQKTNNTWFSRRYYMNWYWRRYWGGSTNPSLNPNEISGLTNNQLSNLITGNFNFTANDSYKYIIIPVESGWVPTAGNPHHYWYGKRPEYIKDISTNLNIALAGPSEGYNDTVNDVTSITYPYVDNNLPCKLMTISNIYGYPTEYYVFRTKYKLGGSIIITIQ